VSPEPAGSFTPSFPFPQTFPSIHSALSRDSSTASTHSHWRDCDCRRPRGRQIWDEPHQRLTLQRCGRADAASGGASFAGRGLSGDCVAQGGDVGGPGTSPSLVAWAGLAPLWRHRQVGRLRFAIFGFRFPSWITVVCYCLWLVWFWCVFKSIGR
jgi:hypothetical protein